MLCLTKQGTLVWVTGLRKMFLKCLKEGIISSSTYQYCNTPDEVKLPQLLLMTCQLQTELALVMGVITAVETKGRQIKYK